MCVVWCVGGGGGILLCQLDHILHGMKRVERGGGVGVRRVEELGCVWRGQGLHLTAAAVAMVVAVGRRRMLARCQLTLPTDDVAPVWITVSPAFRVTNSSRSRSAVGGLRHGGRGGGVGAARRQGGGAWGRVPVAPGRSGAAGGRIGMEGTAPSTSPHTPQDSPRAHPQPPAPPQTPALPPRPTHSHQHKKLQAQVQNTPTHLMTMHAAVAMGRSLGILYQWSS